MKKDRFLFLACPYNTLPLTFIATLLEAMTLGPCFFWAEEHVDSMRCPCVWIIQCFKQRKYSYNNPLHVFLPESWKVEHNSKRTKYEIWGICHFCHFQYAEVNVLTPFNTCTFTTSKITYAPLSPYFLPFFILLLPLPPLFLSLLLFLSFPPSLSLSLSILVIEFRISSLSYILTPHSHPGSFVILKQGLT